MTQDRTIYITKFDLERIEDLLAAAGEFDFRDRKDLEELEAELQEGKLVDSRNVPPTVVTMNSRVQLMDVDEKRTVERAFASVNLIAEVLKTEYQ